MIDAKLVPIQQFLLQVGPRIGDGHVEDAQDWLDHGELGLAIDVIADGLFEAKVTLHAQERQAFIALVQSIGRQTTDFGFLNLDT